MVPTVFPAVTDLLPALTDHLPAVSDLPPAVSDVLPAVTDLLPVVYVAEVILLVASAVVLLFTAVAFRERLLYVEAVALFGLSFFVGAAGWLVSTSFPLDLFGTFPVGADAAVLLSTVGYALATWFLARDFLGDDEFDEEFHEADPDRSPDADEETDGFERAKQ
jgi:hypothetical protein